MIRLDDNNNCRLKGPAVRITVGGVDDNVKSWSLPKALLLYNTEYFRSREEKYEFDQVTPEIFDLFVEFMYYDKITHNIDVTDNKKVMQTAKAWVLGEQLNAPAFQDCAMRKLFELYEDDRLHTAPIPRNQEGSVCLIPCWNRIFGPNRQRKLPIVGYNIIDYCYATSGVNSELSRFFTDLLEVFWHDNTVVNYHDGNREKWKCVFEQQPRLKDHLLLSTKGLGPHQWAGIDVNKYLIAETLDS